MKKQISSVNSWSVKYGLSVTVLCAMIGATEVKATNHPLTDSNPFTKELKSNTKTESGLNKTSCPYLENNTAETVAEEITLVLEQWMANSSYWSSDDSILNYPQGYDGGVKLEKTGYSPATKINENNSL
jgi:hypothetical protein